jgi:hypothetical protein
MSQDTDYGSSDLDDFVVSVEGGVVYMAHRSSENSDAPLPQHSSQESEYSLSLRAMLFAPGAGVLVGLYRTGRSLGCGRVGQGGGEQQKSRLTDLSGYF